MTTIDEKSSKEDVTNEPPKNHTMAYNKLYAKYFPILNWLPKYTKFQAVSDFVAGITLGLTMIPQSIAYATLAGLSSQVSIFSQCILKLNIYSGYV